MSLLFDITNWLIIGAAIYLFLDAIPNGPLSWKVLKKFSTQSDFAVKTIVSLGILLLLAEAFLIGLKYRQFIGDQNPLSEQHNLFLLIGLFSIPLVSQLFRIKVIKQTLAYSLLIALIIIGLDLFSQFYIPFESPRRFYDSSDLSYLGSIKSNLLFHYFISVCLFFIVLDFVVILKKHEIIKS